MEQNTETLTALPLVHGLAWRQPEQTNCIINCIESDTVDIYLQTQTQPQPADQTKRFATMIRVPLLLESSAARRGSKSRVASKVYHGESRRSKNSLSEKSRDTRDEYDTR